MLVADIINAGEALTAVAPFLAGITDKRQHAEAVEFVEHLLLNGPENPLLDLVCAKMTAYEDTAPEFAEFNTQLAAMPAGVATIRLLLDQHELTLSGLPEIGSKPMVSRVLNGERS